MNNFRHITKAEKLFSHITSIGSNVKFKNFKLLREALEEDSTNTLKVLFFVRNPRGGLGKRQCFRDCMSWIARKNIKEWNYKIEDNLHLIPHYGRWDDLFCFMNTKMEKNVFDFIEQYIYKNPSDKSVYKWLPREKSKNKKIAFKIAKHFKLSMKEYRKMLSSNTFVVESLMCKKEWNKIDYNKVPAEAMAKYRWAFYRNDKVRYHNFVTNSGLDCDSDDTMSYNELVRNDKYSLVV